MCGGRKSPTGGLKPLTAWAGPKLAPGTHLGPCTGRFGGPRRKFAPHRAAAVLPSPGCCVVPLPPQRAARSPQAPRQAKNCLRARILGRAQAIFGGPHPTPPPVAVLRPRCLAWAAGWCPLHHNRAGAAPNCLGLPQLACGGPFGAMHGPFCPPPPATWAHDGPHVAPLHTPIKSKSEQDGHVQYELYTIMWPQSCHAIGHKK